MIILLRLSPEVYDGSLSPGGGSLSEAQLSKFFTWVSGWMVGVRSNGSSSWTPLATLIPDQRSATL